MATRLLKRSVQRVDSWRYHRLGERPWSPGYVAARHHRIAEVLSDAALMGQFARGERLPPRYGIGLDERCVEYPWALSRLRAGAEPYLDAGSALNHAFLLDQPMLATRKLTFVGLGPEKDCFWERGHSYLFHDLRRLPLRDGSYDTVVCISTLEHVGADNRQYVASAVAAAPNPRAFLSAVVELARVLAPGGDLLLTVPFGRRSHFSTFQQFDRETLDEAVAAFGEMAHEERTFFRYSATGWNVSTAQECAAAEYVSWVPRPRGQRQRALPVEPDRAAAARAVACVRLVKR